MIEPMHLSRFFAAYLCLGVFAGCAQAGPPDSRAQDSDGQNGPTAESQADSGSDSPLKARPVSARAVHQAKDAWRPTAPLRPWKVVVIHHSAAEAGSVESIHADHKQRRDSQGQPWRGIGYHFVIGNGHGMSDGEVAATFRWQDQLEGAHSGDAHYNTEGIGICLIGNFEHELPTEKQLAAVKRLVARLKRDFGLKTGDVIRHADVKATACPGRLFPFADVARVRLPEKSQIERVSAEQLEIEAEPESTTAQ